MKKVKSTDHGAVNLTLSAQDTSTEYGNSAKPHFLKRVGVVTSLAVAMFAGSGALTTTPAQAASLGDLFGGSSSSQQQEFLKVEDAFSVSGKQQGQKVQVSIDITPGHYVYKDKLKLKLPEGVTASDFKFSHAPTTVDDPVFGKVEVFKQPNLTATTVLKNSNAAPIKQDVTLIWQGCADAGLCYPPQRETVSLNLAADKSSQSAASTNTDSAKSSAATTSEKSASVTKPTSQTPRANQTADLNSAGSNSAGSKNTGVNNASPQNDKSAESTKSASGASESDNELNTNPLSDTDAGEEDALNNAQANESLTGEQTDAQSETEQDVSLINSSQTGVNASSDQQLNNSTGSLFGSENIVDQDPFGLAKHPWLALLLLFLAGLGLAFTPCVLPMLPIVSNIVARQHTPTAKKGLILSGSYALGVAIAYGILGAVIAVFGQSLGIIGWLQNPVILLVFAAVFVLLALYMLDVFRIPVPNAIRQRTHAMSQVGDKYLGSTFGSFIAGLLSALVVSPCVSAPLFGALLAVSTIGNPLLGFAALFMLGFGLSAPLMLLGVSQGNLMPKAGEWMNWVKQGFALLLFAVALLLVERVFISPMMLMLWAVWFMVVAVWAWSWVGRGKLFTRPLAVILAIWSTATLIGAAAGSQDVWQPLRVFTSVSASNNAQMPVSAGSLMAQNTTENNSSAVYTSSTPAGQNSSDLHITSIEELVDIVNQHPKVLVDLTAEWCIECRIMDKTLFTNRPASMQGWQLVRLDVTETNAKSERVLSELRLFGPPALLYFVDGELKVQQVGTTERSEFEKTLNELN